MAHKFGGDAAAALIFLIGYLFLFTWMLWAYITHRIKWKSRYSMLFFHILIRLASQACGIAFAILGFENTDVFLAYLILGAEGYFSLVVCAFRFLISWHQHNFPSHESWMEPRDRSTPSQKRIKALILIFAWPLAPILYRDNPMVFFHTVLILANVAIVVGGSYLAGADYNDPTSSETQNRMQVAKISRTSGQSVFLLCNTLLMAAIVHTIWKDKKEIHSRPNRKVHPTLIILFAAWFPLIVRGIFGVLQAAVWNLSYMNPENYNADGFTSRFAAIEYCLGILTEWLACLLLLTSYYTSRHDPSKTELAETETEKELSAR